MIWKVAEANPAVALPGLALSQSINSRKSRAGMVFLANSTSGVVTSGVIGAKSFSTSYGSAYKALFITCVLVLPSTIV